jgi:hypothetical protein
MHSPTCVARRILKLFQPLVAQEDRTLSETRKEKSSESISTAHIKKLRLPKHNRRKLITHFFCLFKCISFKKAVR